MQVYIIGGGKLAYYLIKTLQPAHHDITIIELEKAVCERIANEFDEVKVYNGDGTNIQLLEEVDCGKADFYIAVTGKDENNLVGCQIAKRHFQVKRTVARVNNPKNMEMFHLLGIDRVYSGTQILADIIEQDIDYIGMRIAYSLENTSKAIVEFRLSPRSDAAGRTLQQYAFPGSSKVVMLTRVNGQVEMPRGDLMMHSGDTMLLVCDENEYDIIWRKMVR
ncbi:MAG: TrkA family potassium uptake protein [Ruminococcaceae bacterium]|nr:TrkA family potassium uptake protein [Oscillospiraceae bacterium]